MNPKTLYFIIITTLSFLLNNANSDCIHNTPQTICQKDIKSRFRKSTYCDELRNDSTKNIQSQKACEDNIKPYFKANYEETEDVKKFGKECKNKMGADWTKCTEILTHFNSIDSHSNCWRMKTMPVLFEIFDKEMFMSETNLKKINLQYSDYKELNRAGVDLRTCSRDINESYENTMDVLKLYMENWNEHYGKTDNQPNICDCEQVMGITNIYKRLKITKKISSAVGDGDKETTLTYFGYYGVSLKISDLEGEGKNELWKKLLKYYTEKEFGDQDKTELSDLLRATCLENFQPSLKNLWTKERLQILADNVNLLDSKKLTTLLTYGVELVRAGWYTPDKPETQWKFDFLLSQIISIDKKEIKEILIVKFSDLFRKGVTQKDYENFLNEPKDTPTLLINESEDCTKEFEGAYIKMNEKRWETKWNHQAFCKYFKTLFSLYTKTPGENTCMEFLNKFEAIEQAFTNTQWGKDHKIKIVQTAFNAGMNIQNFMNCLQLAISLEKATTRMTSTSTYNAMVENSDKNNFRIRLFSNKDEVQNIIGKINTNQYNVYNYDDLALIYRAVLSWIPAPESNDATIN